MKLNEQQKRALTSYRPDVGQRAVTSQYPDVDQKAVVTKYVRMFWKRRDTNNNVIVPYVFDSTI